MLLLVLATTESAPAFNRNSSSQTAFRVSCTSASFSVDRLTSIGHGYRSASGWVDVDGARFGPDDPSLNLVRDLDDDLFLVPKHQAIAQLKICEPIPHRLFEL